MFSEAIVLVGAPVVRSVLGWFENAFEDKKISAFEWGELGATILRVGLIGVGLHFGLDLNEYAAAGSAIVADFILSSIQKIGKK